MVGVDEGRRRLARIRGRLLPPSFLSYLSPSSLAPHTRDPEMAWLSMAAQKRVGGGAAGSPLAGERIPREGECAAVERFHRGTPSPCPSHRGCSGERRLGL
jgi:hypothetical protein